MRSILFLLGWCLACLTFAQKGDLLKSLKGHWKFTVGDDLAWALPTYDDSDWERIKVPARWEDEGFYGWDGFAWYRTSVDGSGLLGRGSLRLNLGYIDDVNEVYFNGQLVGFNGSFPPNFYTAYNALSEYVIPESLIKRGKNTIAVRVYDITLDGGMVSGRKMGFYEEPYGDRFFNLEGVWRFSTRKNEQWSKTNHDDSDWPVIMVPSYWRSKYIKSSYGGEYGWYRKSFDIPKKWLDEELVLLVGLIDDFDTSLLNGRFVGRTYDGKPLGESDSYSKLRVYNIPAGLLKEKDNVLAVQVKDLGLDAGIYRGPVGLLKKSDLTYLLRRLQ